MNFYHNKKRLVRIGENDGKFKKNRGRVEIFEIADDEQFLGCELEYDNNIFVGVTWLKWKIFS